MSSELVERLRERAESYRMGGPSSEHTAALLDDAAARIEALEAEVARLKAERHIPRAPNAGRYLAEVNDGRLLYLNHADDWQGCPNFIAAQEKALDEIIRKDRHTVYRTNQPGREVDGVFARIARRAREGGNADGS